MSAAMLGAGIAAGDLDGLCRAVWGRIGREIRGDNSDQPWVWPILNERLDRARQGMDHVGGVMRTRDAQIGLLTTFEADLRGLLAADAQRFAYCVRSNATNVNGYSIMQEKAAFDAQRVAAQAPQIPRVQPMELVLHLRQRGITITADADGNLQVSPAGMLGEAERAALVANKPAILEVLVRPAVVI